MVEGGRRTKTNHKSSACHYVTGELKHGCYAHFQLESDLYKYAVGVYNDLVVFSFLSNEDPFPHVFAKGAMSPPNIT